MKQGSKNSAQFFLKQLSGPQKILISFELGDLTREVSKAGIKYQYPQISETKMKRLLTERLQR